MCSVGISPHSIMTGEKELSLASVSQDPSQFARKLLRITREKLPANSAGVEDLQKVHDELSLLTNGC
jgi:hypothetical protein